VLEWKLTISSAWRATTDETVYLVRQKERLHEVFELYTGLIGRVLTLHQGKLLAERHNRQRGRK
jgi:hypothetical protein